ncbi:MAG: tRNA (adenosine(37)-N6)-threonylcarbamoyltransferase complex dimerization subunit type 1 TsaB, partial [Alphaproteobacteria bacterium]
MIVLAVDTCLSACTAAVGEDGRMVAHISEPMVRGHQERLALMVAEAMAASGRKFSDLDRIGATVGPGSFTGLRIGLSFAKAMALALDIPFSGFSSLEALSFGHPGRVIAIADARRGQAYWQGFQDGEAKTPPTVSPLAEAAAFAAGRPLALVGPGADLMADYPALLSSDALPGPSPEALIALASRPALGSPAP